MFVGYFDRIEVKCSIAAIELFGGKTSFSRSADVMLT